MKSDPNLSSLIDALRDDLPSEADSARLRARLSALGLAAATSATAAQAAAQTGVAATAEVAATAPLGGWALAAKFATIAAVSATVSSGPLYLLTSPSAAPSEARAPHTQEAQRSTPTARVAESPRAVRPAPLPSEAQRVDMDVAVAARETHERLAPRTIEPKPASPAPISAPAANEAAAVADVASAPPIALAAQPAISSTTPTASSLAEETRLIDASLSALRAADVERAGALLAEHQRRFPNGLLQRERARALQRLATLKLNDKP